MGSYTPEIFFGLEVAFLAHSYVPLFSFTGRHNMAVKTKTNYVFFTAQLLEDLTTVSRSYARYIETECRGSTGLQSFTHFQNY